MSRIGRVVGLVLGVVLVAAWLAIWNLGGGAADLFAPTLVLAAIVAWLISLIPGLPRDSVLVRMLHTFIFAAVLLAVLATLSVGGFLPAVVNEWASPLLGRFGATTAYLLLFGWIMFYAALKRPLDRAALLLDLATVTLFLAFWIGGQTDRQAQFPPVPSSAATLGPRLDITFAILLIAMLLALPAWWISRGSRWQLNLDNADAPVVEDESRRLWVELAAWLWRWTALFSIVALIVSLAVSSLGWYRFAALLVIGAIGAVVEYARRNRNEDRPFNWRRELRGPGWLVLGVLAAALVYFAVSEDLEVVMARNTAEGYVSRFWRQAIYDERQLPRSVGAISGRVYDEVGRPYDGATIVVSDSMGKVFTDTSDVDGLYRLDNVPRGSFLPLAIGPGYRYVPPMTASGRVTTVRPGRETNGVDFQLATRTAPTITGDGALQLGDPTTAHIEFPEPADVSRREFSFYNRDRTLTGGLVHEPPAALGDGPFPILLIIFPGPANYWEGISMPLASQGYVVVSYFPLRLLDVEGDLADLEMLYRLAADDQFSERGDGQNIGLLGGSVSTAWTYRMTLNMEGEPIRATLKAALQYGGLFDMFAFRHSWEQGKVTIDPGISDLEYLLMAFGRPDTRPEIYMYLSPKYTLGPSSLPPTLVVHAGNDIIVPADQSQIAAERLEELGTDYKLLIYPELVHYLDTSTRDPAQLEMLEETLTFLQTYLK